MNGSADMAGDDIANFEAQLPGDAYGARNSSSLPSYEFSMPANKVEQADETGPITINHTVEPNQKDEQ